MQIRKRSLAQARNLTGIILCVAWLGCWQSKILWAQQTPQAQSQTSAQGQQGQTQEPNPAAAEPQATQEVQKSLTQPAPVVEIKRLESEKPVYSIELRNVELRDLFRVIAHDYNLNMIVDKDVSGQITASFTNISLEEALEGIAEMTNLVFEKKGNIIRISPHLITKIFVLKYIEAKKLLGLLSATASTASGATTTTTAAATTTQAANSQATSEEASTPRSSSTVYDLLSKKGRILLGAQPNSVIVIDFPPNVARIAEYIKEVDQKMMSKVFKLKYLKASDVVGDTKAAEVQTQKVIENKTVTSTTGSN